MVEVDDRPGVKRGHILIRERAGGMRGNRGSDVSWRSPDR